MPPRSLLADLRAKYLRTICDQILGKWEKTNEAGQMLEYFNNADRGSKTSVALAKGMADNIGGPFYAGSSLSGQSAGSRFANATSAYLEEAFKLLTELRPGNWTLSTSQGSAGITAYDQYEHLAILAKLAENNPEVRSVLGGDYLICPDIVVGKEPVGDTEIDKHRPVIGSDKSIGRLTPFRSDVRPKTARTLHASISCKWTIRSDRSQNTRTEGLNLLRNRKGKSPQMIVVTAEPLPSRIMSIAIGTGDIDCTYHAALYELLAAAKSNADLEDQARALDDMISSRRLRDISDLPFDLAL